MQLVTSASPEKIEKHTETGALQCQRSGGTFSRQEPAGPEKRKRKTRKAETQSAEAGTLETGTANQSLTLSSFFFLCSTSPCTRAEQDSQIVRGDGLPQSIQTGFFLCTIPPTPNLAPF